MLCSTLEQEQRSQRKHKSKRLQPPPVNDTAFLRALRLLSANPQRTQREMARELGVSLGKVNYVLRALFDRGFVKLQNFRDSRDRRGYAYYLTPAGIAAKAELTRIFLELKTKEYDALRKEIEHLKTEAKTQ